MENVRSKHLRGWLGIEKGCVVAFTSFIDFNKATGGPITIAYALSDRMKGFIADMVARVFRGRIKCFSSLSRSHVPRSLHFIGEACDFAQRG